MSTGASGGATTGPTPAVVEGCRFVEWREIYGSTPLTAVLPNPKPFGPKPMVVEFANGVQVAVELVVQPRWIDRGQISGLSMVEMAEVRIRAEGVEYVQALSRTSSYSPNPAECSEKAMIPVDFVQHYAPELTPQAAGRYWASVFLRVVVEPKSEAILRGELRADGVRPEVAARGGTTTEAWHVGTVREP